MTLLQVILYPLPRQHDTITGNPLLAEQATGHNYNPFTGYPGNLTLLQVIQPTPDTDPMLNARVADINPAQGYCPFLASRKAVKLCLHIERVH